eukprot:GHVP01019364.1.p1 GENE.GHVP01019364.1~~GHVP01019364.1.p1  ORF type:complete len:170 (+),score=11.02 GHVP01019364.1:342-851(+)
MPKIQDIIHRIAQFDFVAKIDLLKAFHYSLLAIEERPYCAFRHPMSQQIYSYCTLPMGWSIHQNSFIAICLSFWIISHLIYAYILPTTSTTSCFMMICISCMKLKIKELLQQASLPINYEESHFNPREEKVILGYRWTQKNVNAEESKIAKLRNLWKDFKLNRTEKKHR